jgi:two-component system, LuxR family, sensor histidine kinase DctS
MPLRAAPLMRKTAYRPDEGQRHTGPVNEPAPALAPNTGKPRRRWRRVLLWSLLIGLLAVAQGLLIFLVLQYEAARAQDRADAAASTAADDVRQSMARSLQALQLLVWGERSAVQWRGDAAELLRGRRELVRLERRDAAFAIVDAVQAPHASSLFDAIPRREQSLDAQTACASARRSGTPEFSRSYYSPLAAGAGLELMDLCLPQSTPDGSSVIATFSLTALLDAAGSADGSRDHEFSFVEGDGARLARAGPARGAGIYRAERVVDLLGANLMLRADSRHGRPDLIPNLSVALVVGLSIALMVLVALLARDVGRRAAAEERLAESLAFRRAMEDSLVTGLRARALDGRITYVNPSFCRMVGYGAAELLAAATPPYWPPERADEYKQRLLGGTVGAESLTGRETVFVRKNGERFPVVIYEAPLVNSVGKHTGWMSAAVDLSEQRRIEDVSRQQQERLQATARLATVGEMASLLSHELNQPLAAIASYASGSLNLLDNPDADADDREMLKQALGRIAEQADRAGRTIKSVHDFVRRREHVREAVAASALIDAVLPLVRLQARKSGARIDVQMPTTTPKVSADRTMVEQVLLNLARNGIQAMESEATPAAERVLQLTVRVINAQWIEFTVADAGPGIAPDVAQRLFTPFFTTRSEGMGLGLSLCRTVIEQHGGALDYTTGASGTRFVFTLRSA